MIYIGLIAIIVIIIIDFFRNRNIFSPVFMFSSLFLLILSLALLKLNDIREFSDKAVYSIELGVIFFAIGAYLVHLTFNVIRKNRVSKPIIVQNEELEVNWVIVKLLVVLMSVGTLITLFNVMNLLKNGMDYSQIRNSVLGYDGEDSLISNPYLRGLVNYIGSPALSTLIPIAIYFFVKKKHHIFYLLVFLNLMIMVFATSGRIMLVYTGIQFLAIIYYSNIKIPKILKKWLLLLSIVGLILIIIISDVRSTNSVFYVFYAYLSGPVVLLSEWQKNADFQNIWTYGLSFFYPFTYIANMVSQFLGLRISILSDAVTWQGAPQEIWLRVFPNMSMNAFATLFYFFYQDFRFLGIVLYSTIFGAICNTVYYKAYYLKQIKAFIVYLLLVKAIIGSFMIWQLGSTTFFVSIVMMWFCLKNKGSVEVYYDN